MGRHQLKFGVDYRSVATRNNPRAYDLFAYFSGGFSAVGGRTALTTVEAQEDITVFFKNLSSFIQDIWKPTSRLTFTLGARWEINPPPNGSKPLYTFLDPNSVPGQIEPAAVGTPLYPTTWGNVAPRVGIAYQIGRSPGNETTVRGGFGLFYDLGAGIISQAASGWPYFRQTNYLQGTFFPVPADQAQVPQFSFKPPINSIYGTQRGFALPVTYQWNLTVERALGVSNALSVGYVGAAGRNLLRQEYWVNPNENITYAYLLRNNAFSDFHSLQAQFQRRLAHGLQVLASYTFSKSPDNNSNDSSSHLIALAINPRQDRGPSDFSVLKFLVCVCGGR